MNSSMSGQEQNDFAGGAFDSAQHGRTPDLCPHGCYWECEHRAASADPRTSVLHPVHDESGRALNRCRECGDFFYEVMEHSREHARKRQLGWLPEHLPADWPSSGAPRLDRR